MPIHIDLGDSPSARSETRSPMRSSSHGDDAKHHKKAKKTRTPKRRALSSGDDATPSRYLIQSTASRRAHLAKEEVYTPKRRMPKLDSGDEGETDKGILAGRRLYSDARSQLKSLEQARAAKEAAAAKEALKYPYRPTVSRYSQEIVEHSMYRPPHERFNAMDAHNEDKRRLQREYERLSLEEEEYRKCSFHPEVNPVSQRLAERDRAAYLRVLSSKSAEDRASATFHRLYQNSEDKERRLEDLKREASAEMERNLVGSSRVTPQRAAEHATRLQSWAQRRDDVLEKLRKETLAAHAVRVSEKEADAIVHRLRQGSISRSASRGNSPRRAGDAAPLSAEVGGGGGGRALTRAESVRREHMKEETHKPKMSAVSSHLAELARFSRYTRTFRMFAKPPPQRSSQSQGDDGVDDDDEADDDSAALEGLSVSVGTIRGLVRNVYTKANGILAVFVHDLDSKLYDVSSFSKALSQFEHLYGPQSWGRADGVVDCKGGLGVRSVRKSSIPVHTYQPTISEESRRIMAERRHTPQRRSSSVTAGEERSANKNADRGVHQHQRTRSDDRGYNTHERLYELGKAQLQQRLIGDEMRKKAIESTPLGPEYTFKPEISEMSRALSQRQILNVALESFRSEKENAQPLVHRRPPSSGPNVHRDPFSVDGAKEPHGIELQNERPEGLNMTAPVNNSLQGGRPPLSSVSSCCGGGGGAMHSVVSSFGGRRVVSKSATATGQSVDPREQQPLTTVRRDGDLRRLSSSARTASSPHADLSEGLDILNEIDLALGLGVVGFPSARSLANSSHGSSSHTAPHAAATAEAERREKHIAAHFPRSAPPLPPTSQRGLQEGGAHYPTNVSSIPTSSPESSFTQNGDQRRGQRRPSSGGGTSGRPPPSDDSLAVIDSIDEMVNQISLSAYQRAGRADTERVHV